MASTQTDMKPPDTIKGDSLAEWKRITAELSSLGRLVAVDRAIMVLHCQTWALNRMAYKHVTDNGMSCTYSNGNVGPTPEYKAWTETTKILRGTLLDLGMTPNARKATKVTHDDDPGELPV